MDGTKSLLTIRQLADELQISKWTIYTWVAQKKIPVVRAGRLLRFKLQAVVDALEKQTK